MLVKSNTDSKVKAVFCAVITLTFLAHSGFSNEASQSRRRFLEIPIGSWLAGPSAVFSYGKGYNPSIGPRIGFRRNLSPAETLTISASHLPVSFSGQPSGRRLDVYTVAVSWRNYFHHRTFLELSAGLNMFRPDHELVNDFRQLLSSAGDRNLPFASISLGYRLFHIPWSWRGRSRKTLFYLRGTFRQTGEYLFGAKLGEAGDRYGRLRRGFIIGIQPVFRRF